MSQPSEKLRNVFPRIMNVWNPNLSEAANKRRINLGDLDEVLLESSDEDDRQGGAQEDTQGETQQETQGDAEEDAGRDAQEDNQEDAQQDIEQDAQRARQEDREDGDEVDRQNGFQQNAEQDNLPGTQQDAQQDIQPGDRPDLQKHTEQDIQQARQEHREDGGEDDRQHENQQASQPDRQQDRQKYPEEAIQKQDQQSIDHDSPQKESDLAQVSAITEGSSVLPTQDPTHDLLQQTTAVIAALETTEHSAERDQLVRALRRPVPDGFSSPLFALQHQVKECFQFGGWSTSHQEWMDKFGSSLFAATSRDSTKIPRPPHDKPRHTPKSWSEAATTTVGAFACPADRLSDAITFQTMASMKDVEKAQGASLNSALAKAPGSTVGQAIVSKHLSSSKASNQEPSASLQTASTEARALARGSHAECSLIMVLLVDVHLQELEKQGRQNAYTTFMHSFTMGVSPEGVIIWQAWGPRYGLGEWISKGGADVRTLEKASEFVDNFEKFVAYKGKWDAKRNKLYNDCFDVDIFKMCDAKGGMSPIVPKVESLVRVLVMEDVQLDDIYKFTFE